MPGPRSTFSAIIALPGVLLTSVVLIVLCFIAAERGLSPSVLFASLVVVVPTGVRTFVVLKRKHADEGVVDLQKAIGVLVTSAVLTVAVGAWFIFVVSFTVFLRTFDEGQFVIIPVLLVSLVLWFVLPWKLGWRDHVDAHKLVKFDWQQLWRIRFTMRGMLIGVALIALPLWLVHILLMQPIYRQLASTEAFVADLCLAESRLMANRAEECRRRAARGVAWNQDDDTSIGLKVCPYTTDQPGRSWLEQAGIWDRAAERSRVGAERHLAKSESY